MTTSEMQLLTMSLDDAVVHAGVGGTLIGPTSGMAYTVGRNEFGAYTLDSGSGPETLEGYQTGLDWTISAVVSHEDTPAGDDPADEVGTLREFFTGMPAYAQVSNRYNSYIFLGWEVKDSDGFSGGETSVKLLHSRYMNIEWYESGDLSNTAESLDWTVERNESGTHKLVDQVTRHTIRHLNSYRNEVQGYVSRVAELENSYREAVADFKTVNAKINEYADEMQMCPDYERRIFGWNNELQHIKLQGRPKAFQVAVNIPELSRYTMYARPEGTFTNAEQAIEEVRSWSREELIKHLMNEGWSFTELNINPTFSEAQMI